MSPVRAYFVAKCKTALCGHTTFAPDDHSLCFRCKLSNGTEFCCPASRCVECQFMSVRHLSALIYVAVKYRLTGIDMLVCTCTPVVVGYRALTRCVFRLDQVAWRCPSPPRCISSTYVKSSRASVAKEQIHTRRVCSTACFSSPRSVKQ